MTIMVALRHYYANERAVSFAFIVFATLSMLVGAALLLQANRLVASAIGIPLVIVGIVLAIGGVGYLRQVTAKEARALPLLQQEPSQYKREEMEAIRTTAKRYRIYRGVETTLLLTAIALAFFGAQSARSTMLGVGLGLALAACGAFTIDSFGAYHTALYEREIARFDPGPVSRFSLGSLELH
jgi:hypothetical protein